MRPLRLLPLLALSAAGTAAAQRPAAADRGAFVVTLGRDTVAVEQFTRRPAGRGSVLEGDVMTRQPEVRVTHYTVALDARGRPTSAETRTRTAAGAVPPKFPTAARATFAADTAAYELTFPDSVARKRLAAPAGTLPNVNYGYGLYEVATRRARAAGRAGDVVRDTLHVVSPNAPRAFALALAVARDSATLDYFGDPLLLRLDPAGRILAVDGTRTTGKVLARRVASVDVAGVARAFAARPAMGAASPTDSVTASVGAAQVAVVYSRPSVRGRTVWGGVLVPYGQVWRTGANAATALRTSADLMIGGARVPAGRYTLFTVPTAERAELVISKQTGQWGTEYTPGQDLARVPLAQTALSAPVEQFTIAVENSALVLRWGDRQYSVPVTAVGP